MKLIPAPHLATAAKHWRVALRSSKTNPALSIPTAHHHHHQESRSQYSSLARKSSEGKNAIITGSSRGIGRAIALRLAADGYNICINDVDSNSQGCEQVAAEVRAMGRKACVSLADVSKRDEVKAMVQRCVKELGPLSTMVANAGINQVKPLLDITEEDFRRMFAVNVFGVQNCYAEAARQMLRQGTCRPDSPGKIIGAASISSFKPDPLVAHYAASKWAVRGLTQSYAQGLAPSNINVNAYAPGIVGTDMWDLLDAGFAEVKGVEEGSVIEKTAHELTALGRVSVPEDVAKLVSFLASSDSDFVTGQTQVVDGGIIFT